LFYWHSPSSFYRFDVIIAFPLAEDGGMTISAAKGFARPEMTSPFDSMMAGCWNFSSISHRSKLIRLFKFLIFHVKRPEKIWRKGYCLENFFPLMRPQKAPPWVNPRRSSHHPSTA
jgi:hypothetical protein